MLAAGAGWGVEVSREEAEAGGGGGGGDGSRVGSTAAGHIRPRGERGEKRRGGERPVASAGTGGSGGRDVNHRQPDGRTDTNGMTG